jgi:hypothetical protein
MAVLGWSAVLWVLLLSPKVSRVAWFPGSAYLFNMAHGFVFGLEALLIGCLLRPDPQRESRLVWLCAAALALAYGGLLEWLQGFVDGRSSSTLDMVTNAVGAFGAPWALAVGTPFHRRTLIVIGAAAVSAVVATRLG